MAVNSNNSNTVYLKIWKQAILIRRKCCIIFWGFLELIIAVKNTYIMEKVRGFAMRKKWHRQTIWTALALMFLLVSSPALTAYAAGNTGEVSGAGDVSATEYSSMENTEESIAEESVTGTEETAAEESGSDAVEPAEQESVTGTEEAAAEESGSDAVEPVSEEFGTETGVTVTEESDSGTVETVTEESASGSVDPVTEESGSEGAETVTEESGADTAEAVSGEADTESVETDAQNASREILAEKVDTSEIKEGDKIMIVSAGAECSLSQTSTNNKISPSSVTIKETAASRKVITEYSQSAAIFEVTDMSEGQFCLKCEKGYLTSTDTGSGVYYSEEAVDCSRWEFENNEFLYNPNAVYSSSSGASYKNNYLEYYSSNFTMYGKSSSSDTSPFSLYFFRMGNSKPEDVIPEEDYYTLPLFYTSDIHGYLADNSGDDPLYLMAYISDKVKDVRGYGEDFRKDLALLMDGGDIYQGNTMSNLLKGKPLSEAFQIMGYDAVTIGNHEFDWGIEYTVDSDKTIMDYGETEGEGVNSVPVIVCNMFRNGEKVPFADDYIILDKTAVNEKGEELPVKIGVIGYVGDYASSIMNSMFTGAGYTIDPGFDTANEIAKQLEDSGACDMTILLAHHAANEVAEGLGEDTVIDYVLGGHTHQNLKGQTEWGLKYIEPTSYSEAYIYAGLAFDKENDSPVFLKVADSKIINTKEDVSLLTNTPENAEELDPELVTVTERVLNELENIFKTVIGRITVSALRDTYIENSGNRASTCGNWMCSIIKREVGADVAFVNSGGIRTDFLVDPEIGSRDFTLGDVYAMFPFGNKLCCFEITYGELLQALEYSMTEGAGSRLLSRIIGIDCYYTDGTVNAVVTEDGQEVYVNGEWREGWKDKKLKVVVSDYIATTNRVSEDGQSNPFVAWYDTDRLIEDDQVDNEGAIAVLTNEAAANDGLLEIDTKPHFINAVYEIGVTVDEDGLVYNGKEQEPAVTVKYGSQTLEAGTDYSLTYANNINAGNNKASVTVTLQGNYEGTVTKTFSIARADQKVTVKSLKVPLGETAAISVEGAQGEQIFTSADDTIATVDSEGVVTGKKFGKVRITLLCRTTQNYNAVKKALNVYVVPAASGKFKANNQPTGVKLTWSKVPGATGYNIYRGNTRIFAIRDADVLTRTDKKANTNGTQYTYRIVAVGEYGTSTLAASLKVNRLARPAISALTNSASGKMKVTWGRNAKASGYQIQYGTDNKWTNARIIKVADASSVSRVISGLTKNKIYYVRVRSYKGANSSAWSVTKRIKIQK